MATYSQLLIDSGSGIVDRRKQSKQEDGATLIIGLGGTGGDLLIKLKHEVYKQMQPDDLEAPLPEYKKIRFLYVDSDNAKIKEQKGYISDIVEKTEYFDVSCPIIKERFKNKEELNRRPDMTWLDHEHIKMDEASAGAGGIRQIGRFLLIDKLDQFYQKLKSAISGALVGSNVIHVHVIAGISGGTGSGTFLDVCYLVRHALKELGQASGKVYGYFFLPDVNLSVPAVASNTSKSSYIKYNGYSALQELDYCMNLERNKDFFEQRYATFTVKTQEQPVDLCYLVSTTNADGMPVPNGYEYAMGVVTDYIISFLAKVESPKTSEDGKDEGSQGITLLGHISNLNSDKANIKMSHGAGIDYNILGASVAEVPLSEIATYLGAKLFEAYTHIFDLVPSEKDRDAFVKAVHLTYDELRNELTKGCKGVMQFSDRFDAEAYKKSGNAMFVQHADEFLAANIGQMEANAKTMKNEDALKDNKIPENASSLLSRVFKKLCEDYASKIEYGPIFAHLLLTGGTNKNLIHWTDGLIAHNQELWDAEARQTNLRVDSYKDADERMKNAGLLNKGSRIQDYRNALNNLYVHHYKMDMYQKLDDVLKRFKKLVTDLDSSFFAVLQDVMFTLRDTFKKNIEILTQKGVEDRSYNWKILSINEVIDGLNEEVKKLDVEQTLYRLMVGMFEHVSDWKSNDESKIAKIISTFVLDEFSEATKKTITDYLKEKYHETDIVRLADKIEQDIMRDKLAVKAQPMFWQDMAYGGTLSKLNYLTVPFDSKEIVTAAEKHIEGNSSFAIRKSQITDKLSMMCFHSGMPLYAYQGLKEFERVYEQSKMAGKHLFGKGEKDWNELLPSPIPESARENLDTPRIQEKNKKLKELFQRALESGIITVDEQKKHHIRVTADLDMDSYNASIEENSGNIAKLTQIQKELEERQVAFKEGEVKEIVDIPYGNPITDLEERVTEDFFILSPVMNKMVEKEVEKRNRIEEAIHKVKDAIVVGGVGGRMKKDFLEAIFTGVLKYGKSISYEYEEFGMPKKVVLQDNTMGDLADTGAFFAFEKFKEIDEKIRQKIRDEANKRMNMDECPEMDAAIADLEAKMPQRIQAYLMRHDETTLEHNDLTAYYENFMKELAAFKLQVTV